MTFLPHHPAGLPVVSTAATKRTRAGTQEDTPAAIADEAAVALVFNGITHAVMMASPTDLEDFALGFALSEGIIDSRADWRGADVETHPHGLEVHAEIASHCFVRLKERRRRWPARPAVGCAALKACRLLKTRRNRLCHPRGWHHLPTRRYWMPCRR